MAEHGRRAGVGDEPTELLFGAATVVLFSVLLAWTTSVILEWEWDEAGTHSERALAMLALATIVVWALLAPLIAREWGRSWLRIYIALAVVTALILTVKVGRREVDDARAAERRAAATTLDHQRVELRRVSDEATAAATGTVRAAGDAVSMALGVGQQANGTPLCPPGPAKTADQLLCEAIMIVASKEPSRLQAATKVTAARQLSGGDLGLRDRNALVEQAMAAVTARDARSDVDGKDDAAAGAVAAFCLAAGGRATGQDTLPRPCAEIEGGRSELDELADKAAAAKVAVTDLAVAVHGRGDGRGPALDAALAAERAAESSIAATEPADVMDLVREGADAIVSAAPGVGGDRVPIGLAVVGWSVLGALAVLAYRRLEIANARFGRGTVSFGALQGAGKAKEEIEPAFRRYVLENVAEPGAIPGTSSSLALSTLSEATKDPASKLAAELLKLVRDATASTSGYLVETTYRKTPPENGKTRAPDHGSADETSAPDHGSADETSARDDGSADETSAPDDGSAHEVFVRVRDGRTGVTLSRHANRAATADLALRRAGYWAAAVVLERDARMPAWARWKATSSDALAAYDYAEDGGSGSAQKLADALDEAPTSGLLLLRLANQYDIDGDRLSALELNLRACTIYPRFPQARYRLAVSLSMVAGTFDRSWPTDPAAQRRVVASLRRCISACHLDDRATLGELDLLTPSGVVVARIGQRLLLDLADTFRQSIKDLLSWRTIAKNALRRSERAIWLPMLVRRDARQRRDWARQTMAASKYAIDAYRSGTQPDKEPTEFTAWQALYNIACAYAIVGASGGLKPRERAVSFLEQALEAPEGEQLSREWLMADPDLRSIRQDTGFRAICERVRDKEKSEEATP